MAKMGDGSLSHPSSHLDSKPSVHAVVLTFLSCLWGASLYLPQFKTGSVEHSWQVDKIYPESGAYSLSSLSKSLPISTVPTTAASPLNNLLTTHFLTFTQLTCPRLSGSPSLSPPGHS